MVKEMVMVDFVHPFKGKKPGDEISKQELISAVRLSLCAEEEATHLYDTIAEFVKDAKVQKLMRYIASEEQVHIGEFQQLLNELEDDEEEKVSEGEKEAEDKMGGSQSKEESKTEDIITSIANNIED